MTSVNVVDGDITQIKADALITAINSGGMWFGGLDGAIQRSSGSMFHGQAQAAMPLTDGQADRTMTELEALAVAADLERARESYEEI